MSDTQLINSLISAFPSAVLVIDKNERIVAANPKAKTLFGQNMTSQNYISALRQPLLLDAIKTTLQSGTSTSTTYKIPEFARDTVFEVSVTPTNGTHEIYIVVSLEDRTDLQDAHQMRKDFVANVSHELRTPLTAVLGFIETLMGPASKDADKRTRFLSIMDVEAKRMNRIVGDLLSLSQVEAKRRVRPRESVNLEDVVSSVSQTLEPLAQMREISVHIENNTIDTDVIGDRDQLTQVFTNLLENAIKYGGKTKTVNVHFLTQSIDPILQTSTIKVDINDQGPGIPAQHIPRLTERFYRVDSHRSQQMGGTGLGLAIVKHILTRHRGRLHIESTLGKGSCFSVILPLQK